jgi:DNA polymerase III, epsilon subunit and related 3''-5'' exonucleases
VHAKWYDQPDVMRFAEWDKGGRGTFLKRVHALMGEADIIVGHNLDGADVPWLKGDFYLPRIGHPYRPNFKPMPPFKTVDTLKVLRREFKSGAPFKSLDAMCQIVGIPGKTDKYDREAMERAVAGSVEDQQRETDYCEGDVIATQWFYDWLRPHIKNHPALHVDGQGKLDTCRACGNKTEPIAKRWAADVFTYTMQRCTVCGWHGRLSIEPERMSLVRGV